MKVFCFFICFVFGAVFGMEVDEERGAVAPSASSGQPPQVQQSTGTERSRLLRDRPCYEQCEYHYWDCSSCCLRVIGGGIARTVHGISSISTFICTALLTADLGIDSSARYIIGAVGMASGIVGVVTYNVGISALKEASQREQNAEDIVEHGRFMPRNPTINSGN